MFLFHHGVSVVQDTLFSMHPVGPLLDLHKTFSVAQKYFGELLLHSETYRSLQN